MAELISFDEFKKFWDRDPIVVIDSSSLLDLYRYSSDTTKSILNNFEQIRDNLWIPAQVLDEYNDNKGKVKSKAFKKYTDVTKEVTNIISKARADISKRFIRYGKFKFPQINNLRSKIEEQINELLQEAKRFESIVADEIDRNSKTLREDQVDAFVQSLVKNNKVGPALQLTEKISIYQEGEYRYKHLIPPGYMDIEKDKDDPTKTKKFGDLIVWKEILKKASKTNRPFIFITDDEKEDWWELSKSEEILGPRKELISEFAEWAQCKNNGFIMLTLSQFDNLISSINRTNNIEAHQSYVELNAEEIALDIIEHKDWHLVLDKDLELTSYLIHSGQLQEHMGQVLSDVEITAISKPQFDSLYVDIDDETVIMDGTFTCDVEAEIESSFSKYYSTTDSVVITISGRISLELTIDYDKSEDFIDIENSKIHVDDLEIVDCEFINDDHDYESIACVRCGRDVGTYFTSSGDPVCEKCFNTYGYEVCPKCGKLYDQGTLDGAFCYNCVD